MNTSGCVACARRRCLELSTPILFSDAVASRICFMEEKHEIPKKPVYRFSGWWFET
jgi:hypothetical protein